MKPHTGRAARAARRSRAAAVPAARLASASGVGDLREGLATVADWATMSSRRNGIQLYPLIRGLKPGLREPHKLCTSPRARRFLLGGLVPFACYRWPASCVANESNAVSYRRCWPALFALPWAHDLSNASNDSEGQQVPKKKTCGFHGEHSPIVEPSGS
jgi:hypothetical protein